MMNDWRPEPFTGIDYAMIAVGLAIAIMLYVLQ